MWSLLCEHTVFVKTILVFGSVCVPFRLNLILVRSPFSTALVIGSLPVRPLLVRELLCIHMLEFLIV